LLIGSGAIESAHRTVLQKRMKQSGQRWSKKGLEKMISLRVLNVSGYWNKIRDLITKAAYKLDVAH
ncbi:MAG: ISLre2 family transposase, partial [Saprospiraceae bacterium]